MRVLNEQVRVQVVRLREAGMSFAQIAKALRLNVNTVKSWCRRQGITPQHHSKTDVEVVTLIGCAQCGSELSGRQRRFCCEACRRAWWKNHPDQIQRKAFYHFTCTHCGKPFIAYGNANRHYCSHACYIRHRFNTRGGRP